MPATAKPLASQSLTRTQTCICQILAIAGEAIDRSNLNKLLKSIDWPGRAPKVTTIAALGPGLDKLMKAGQIEKGSYQSVIMHPANRSRWIMAAWKDGSFDGISETIQKKWPLESESYRRLNPKHIARDLKIAFFRGDRESLDTLAEQVHPPTNFSTFVNPFDATFFAKLPLVSQQRYLADAIPQSIMSGKGSADLASLAADVLAESEQLDEDFVMAIADAYLAAGNFAALQELDDRLGNLVPSISGYGELLRGNFDEARKAFQNVILKYKDAGRISDAAVNSLAGVYFLLLSIGSDASASKSQISSTIKRIRASGDHYASLVPLFECAKKFHDNPHSPPQFVEDLGTLAQAPLGRLVAGYLWVWKVAPADAPLALPGFPNGCLDYAPLGYRYLAAELAALAGETPLDLHAELSDVAEQLHQHVGSRSLVNWQRPIPQWQTALDAIRGLTTTQTSSGEVGTEEVFTDERMIWELNCRKGESWVDVRPFIQKRSGKAWTKGRPVALERIYTKHQDAEFHFLTDQDQLICKSLDSESYRGHYGYLETSYNFDDAKLAAALVNHPRLFAVGERQRTVEVSESSPELKIDRSEAGRISISLQPPPTRAAIENGFQFAKVDSHHYAVVRYTPQQLKLHKVLDGTLSLPAAAESAAMAAISPLASMVTIHSEVELEMQADQNVAPHSDSHLHAIPYEAGLQLDFRVRPFGDDGPFFAPGVGPETVVAKIGNETFATKRQIHTEREQLASVLMDCPSLLAELGRKPGDSAEDLGAETIYLSTSTQALEALLELEAAVSRGQLTMHWPRGQSLQLIAESSGRDFRVDIRRDRDWFAASGTLQVNDSLSLDMMQLLDMVDASPNRFVQLDDGRFLALTNQFRQHLEAMSAYGDHNQDRLRIPPIRALAIQDVDETCQVKSDKHWKDCLRRIRDADEIDYTIPSTLTTDLRDYQREGFEWMARLSQWGAGACLADDMGLGKTIQTLALLLHRANGPTGSSKTRGRKSNRAATHSIGPALVVAPTSVGFNWASEINRYAPTLTPHLFGPGDRAEMLHGLGPRDVVICSYGLLHQEAEKLHAQNWHTIVLDEAQAIKNADTRRSEAAMKLTSDFRLILTGTPMENHLGELWNLFQFINPGLLGSRDSFNQKFAIPIERDNDNEARRYLKKLIQPFILRRTKSQVLDELPSRTEITLQVELSDEETAMYEALRRKAVKNLEDTNDDDRPTHIKILAELMRLRRFCCHPDLVTPNAGIPATKLALFNETISELLEGNHKVLVFSQFVDHLSILKAELDQRGISYQYLDGSTPAAQRKKRVEAFQAGEGDVFLISLKAGGVGLNLTAADYVMHMDPWWNPAVEDQASDRAHRLGQQRPVTIYRFITTDTVEERILQLHSQKRDLADSLLEGTDRPGKLSTEELLKLIQS
ncbi:DEAD/DEAH box helicase [Allorhodopirellula solitaria]|uniref:ATP-dependent helicase HepA n=1 Tax=Allorhodopirellula solitaria TaxID=2527987 RepID=A0A5C5YG70_9BACT|nr:DEAD/DEAH box helicase [Allorhodopirellula solitaria]TWT73959.1 ATP-dependent helicase HepA [Allorhodopirellula solitaria]